MGMGVDSEDVQADANNEKKTKSPIDLNC